MLRRLGVEAAAAALAVGTDAAGSAAGTSAVVGTDAAGSAAGPAGSVDSKELAAAEAFVVVVVDALLLRSEGTWSGTGSRLLGCPNSSGPSNPHLRDVLGVDRGQSGVQRHGVQDPVNGGGDERHALAGLHVQIECGSGGTTLVYRVQVYQYGRCVRCPPFSVKRRPSSVETSKAS